MGSLNGVRHQIATLERRWPAPAPEPVVSVVDEAVAFWERVFEIAPLALRWYIVGIDAEAAGDPDYDVDKRHPALKDALEALFHFDRTLRRIQGQVMRMACWRYGWALAFERSAGKTATWYDATVQERAAEELLGWSKRDVDAAWLEHPGRYLEQWRSCGTRDVAILEKARLGELEVELLLEDEEEDA